MKVLPLEVIRKGRRCAPGRLRRLLGGVCGELNHLGRSLAGGTTMGEDLPGGTMPYNEARASYTTQTRTSWRHRRGCVTMPTPRCERRSSRFAIRAATSCARQATHEDQTARPRWQPSRGSGHAIRPRSTVRDEAAQIMSRKNFAATGSFVAEDRARALDLLRFSSQLVFNTFHNRRLRDWEHGGDLDLAYGAARAHNRGMVEFCSVDPRLLPDLLRASRRLRPGGGHGARSDLHGRRRTARGVGLPADTFTEPRRLGPGVGSRPGRRDPRRLPRGRDRVT